jgi:hypothetical protein
VGLIASLPFALRHLQMPAEYGGTACSVPLQPSPSSGGRRFRSVSNHA